jgi:hypothetical protein
MKSSTAHEVLHNDEPFQSQVKEFAPNGIDHIVEVAFGANI